MSSLSGVVLRTQTDTMLLTLAAGGSEPAFETLVQRHHRALHAYCRRLLVSEVRSEDVVQQALINAWQAVRAGTEVREPRAWLYRITHNQAMSALRRPEFDFSELEESLQAVDAPEAELERRTLMRETLAAVAALPSRQQEVILRTAIEGQSYEQVAAALGLSSHAVRGLAHRARSSIRAAMAAAVPAPLVVWAAERARPASSGAGWLELLGGTGGGVGASAAVLKGATLLASTAAIVGGTVSGVIKLPMDPGARPPAVQDRLVTSGTHPAHAALRTASIRSVAVTSTTTAATTFAGVATRSGSGTASDGATSRGVARARTTRTTGRAGSDAHAPGRERTDGDGAPAGTESAADRSSPADRSIAGHADATGSAPPGPSSDGGHSGGSGPAAVQSRDGGRPAGSGSGADGGFPDAASRRTVSTAGAAQQPVEPTDASATGQ